MAAKYIVSALAGSFLVAWAFDHYIFYQFLVVWQPRTRFGLLFAGIAAFFNTHILFFIQSVLNSFH